MRPLPRWRRIELRAALAPVRPPRRACKGARTGARSGGDDNHLSAGPQNPRLQPTRHGPQQRLVSPSRRAAEPSAVRCLSTPLTTALTTMKHAIWLVLLPLVVGCDGLTHENENVLPAPTTAPVTANAGIGGGTSFTLSGEGTFDEDGSGTVYLSTPSIADDRSDVIDPDASFPSASAITSATVSGGNGYGRIGSQTYSAPLAPEIQTAISDQADHLQADKAAAPPPRMPAPSPPSSAQMQQNLIDSGYQVVVASPTTYRLSRSVDHGDGSTTTYVLVTDRNTNEILSSEIRRNGTVAMSLSHQMNGTGERTAQVTAYPRPGN